MIHAGAATILAKALSTVTDLESLNLSLCLLPVAVLLAAVFGLPSLLIEVRTEQDLSCVEAAHDVFIS